MGTWWRGTFLRSDAVDHLRASPAFRRAKDHHWPPWTIGRSVLAGVVLDLRNFLDDFVEGIGEKSMDHFGLLASDDVDPVTVSLEQRDEFVIWDASENRGIRDLVAVQVEDRQDGTVVSGIEELVRVPARPSGPVSASPSPTTQQTRESDCRRPLRTRVRASSRARPPH